MRKQIPLQVRQKYTVVGAEKDGRVLKSSMNTIGGRQYLRLRCKRSTLSRKATDLMDNLFCMIIRDGDVCNDNKMHGRCMDGRKGHTNEVVRETPLPSVTTIIVLFSFN